MDRIDEKLLGASVAKEEIARTVGKSKVGEAVTGAGLGIREIREKVSGYFIFHNNKKGKCKNYAAWKVVQHSFQNTFCVYDTYRHRFRSSSDF